MAVQTHDFQPNWSNQPTYNDLNNDVYNASGIQEEIRADLIDYKLIKEGGPVVRVKPGKSSVRPKVVRKQQEWKYAVLEDPFLSSTNLFEFMPRTAEDVVAAKNHSLLINYQYETKLNKVKLVGDIARTLEDEGTVIVKTGWLAEYATRAVMKERPVYGTAEESFAIIQNLVTTGKISPAQAEEILLKGEPVQVGAEEYEAEEEYLAKNQPTHQVCDTANVGLDPQCEGDIGKAKFVYHEYDTSYADVVKNKYEEHEDGSTSGYYFNIEQALANDSEVSYNYNKPLTYSLFKYNDKARKKVKAIEYWGYWDIQGDGVLVPIVAEWVNSILIRLEKNPYAHQRIPFSMCQYMPVLKATHGEPDAKLLEENQLSIQKYTRAAHDITSTAAVGQEFIDEQMMSPAMRNQYEKGNTVF